MSRATSSSRQREVYQLFQNPTGALVDYQFVKIIVQNRHHTIVLAKWLAKAGDLVVLKITNTLTLSPTKINNLWREAQIPVLLSSCNVPNICNVHWAFVHEDIYIIIVQQYCEQGTLLDLFVRRGVALTEAKACVHVAVPLLVTLWHLHSRSTVHADIKLENLFMSKNVVVLGDFGMTQTIQSRVKTFMGTVEFMAPEVAELHRFPSMTDEEYKAHLQSCKGFAFEADIWSLGVVMYECLCGCRPWSGHDKESVLSDIIHFRINPFPPQISELARTFILDMLTPDPDKRPTAFELLEHEWVRKHIGYSLGTLLDLSDGEVQSRLQEKLGSRTAAKTMVRSIRTIPSISGAQSSAYNNVLTSVSNELGAASLRRERSRSGMSARSGGPYQSACSSSSPGNVLHTNVPQGVSSGRSPERTTMGSVIDSPIDQRHVLGASRSNDRNVLASKSADNNVLGGRPAERHAFATTTTPTELHEHEVAAHGASRGSSGWVAARTGPEDRFSEFDAAGSKSADRNALESFPAPKDLASKSQGANALTPTSAYSYSRPASVSAATDAPTLLAAQLQQDPAAKAVRLLYERARHLQKRQSRLGSATASAADNVVPVNRDEMLPTDATRASTLMQSLRRRLSRCLNRSGGSQSAPGNALEATAPTRPADEGARASASSADVNLLPKASQSGSRQRNRASTSAHCNQMLAAEAQRNAELDVMRVLSHTLGGSRGPCELSLAMNSGDDHAIPGTPAQQQHPQHSPCAAGKHVAMQSQLRRSLHEVTFAMAGMGPPTVPCTSRMHSALRSNLKRDMSRNANVSGRLRRDGGQSCARISFATNVLEIDPLGNKYQQPVDPRTSSANGLDPGASEHGGRDDAAPTEMVNELVIHAWSGGTSAIEELAQERDP